MGFLPSAIRSDRGTENCIIEGLQQVLRFHHDDNLAGLRSFIKGKSTSNQRIECYWGSMRQLGVDFWISFFKDLRDNFVFDSSNQTHVECLRFCFGPLINYELQMIRTEWNRHRIRRQKNCELRTGSPNHLFYCASSFGANDYKKPVNIENIDILLEKYASEPQLVNPNFSNMTKNLIPNVQVPISPDEALSLYHLILESTGNDPNQQIFVDNL